MELKSLTEDDSVGVEDYGTMNKRSPTTSQSPSSDDTALILTDDKLAVRHDHYCRIPCISIIIIPPDAGGMICTEYKSSP